MAVSYVAAGAGAVSSTATVVPMPAGLATNDLLVMVVETANAATTISATGGGTWTQVTGSPQGVGVAGSTTATGCQVFWSNYNGTQTAPTLADAGDHQAGRIYAFRGVDPTTPINASAGAVGATSTAVSTPSVVTTVADAWVLHAVCLMDDAMDFGATWTNANLAGITLRNASYSWTTGNDGRLALVTGTKAAAGAVGSTTNTLTATSVKGYITLALKPESVTGGAVTLTVPVAKPQAVALSPLAQPNTTTLTPTTSTVTAVALSPAGTAGTSVLPPVIRAAAVPVDPVGTGPGAGVVTPATLRALAVPVDPVPQPVTTTITPAVFKTQPGTITPVSSVTETFTKADGTPLGPNLTWTRRVYLASDQWTVASNRARYAISSPATEVDTADLQVPAPNLAITDQAVSVTVHTLNATFPVGTSSDSIIGLATRFALHTANTDFRGYVAALARTQIDIFGIGVFVDAVALAIARYDTFTERFLITSGTSSQQIVFALHSSIVFPATLTVTARGNQIFATFEYGATRPLSVVASDDTYSDGGVALLGRINTFPGHTVTFDIDNFVAAPASPGPETTLLAPAVLTAETGRMWRPNYDTINAGDDDPMPVDIFDGGDTSTPPADGIDANPDSADSSAAQLVLTAVPLSPVGVDAAAVTLTPATFKAVAVAISVAAAGSTEAQPATLKAIAVPAVSVVPGEVTTTATPSVARFTAVPVDPVPQPGLVTLNPATLETQTGNTAPAGAGAMSIPPVTARFTAVPVSPAGVGPGAATLTPPTAKFVAVAVASVVPGVVITTATPATLKAQAVVLTPASTAAVTLTAAVIHLEAFPISFLVVTIDLDITIGPTRHRSRLDVEPTRGTGTEVEVEVTRPPHEIEVTRHRSLTETSATRDRPRATVSATRSRAQTETSDTRQGIGVGPTRDGQEP